MQEFFEKYKSLIIGGVVGALVAVVLSYLLQIPFWVTGAIIGASSSWLTEIATKQFDEQYAKLEEKRKADKAKKTVDSSEEKS